MSEHLEIEFKNLLIEAEFTQLIERFDLNTHAFWSQTNYYFDTVDFYLKKKGFALRIREKRGVYEFTLKQPTKDGVGLLETNQELDRMQAELLINNGTMPTGVVSEKLFSILTENQKITCFGNMKTERAEIVYESGLLVFDKSYYFDVIDFEIEYEVQHYARGQEAFHSLLDSEGIPIRKTPNKIRRFYDIMIKQNA